MLILASSDKEALSNNYYIRKLSGTSTTNKKQGCLTSSMRPYRKSLNQLRRGLLRIGRGPSPAIN